MTPSKPLSDTQQAILGVVKHHLARYRLAPTIREIGVATGISSTSVIGYNLKRLEEAGYIRLHEGKARSITLVEESDPAVDLREVLADHADNLELLAAEVYELDADTLYRALTARAEGLRAALTSTQGVAAGVTL